MNQHLRYFQRFQRLERFERFEHSSRGFGIIEVLVSAMIMVMIIGAAIALNRAMVRRNVDAAEKVQAYNLVREGLEISRAYRDTKWIDRSVNTWDENFPSQNFIFIKNENGSFTIETSSGEEDIIPDNVTYTRTYAFTDLSGVTDLNTIVNMNNDYGYDLSDELKVIKVTVSWGDNKQVEAATILTDWKPQI